MYEVFDRAEDSHWWFLARRRIVLCLVRGLIRKTGSRPRILDIGCGMGGTLRELEKLGAATGVDISSRAVEFSRRRGCRDVRRIDGLSLPFREGSFDLVVSLDVIEHIEDDVAALREYGRVLAPSGRLLITVPAFSWLWSRHDDDNLHLRRYTRRFLRSRLAAAGLRPERITYFCTFLFPLVVLVRLWERMRPRPPEVPAGQALAQLPPALNRVLAGVFGSERLWLSLLGFPWGSSLLAVCRPKEGA